MKTIEQTMLRVRAERLALGWTQHEVSRRADVSAQMLSNIECGTYRPKRTSAVIQRLAQLYGVPAEDLLKPVSQ